MTSQEGRSDINTAAGSRDIQSITLDSKPVLSRRLRRALDCLLILLVLLIVVGDPSTARAGSEVSSGSELPAQARTTPAGSITNRVVNAQWVGAPPDDNTLAAVIAAENSALTPPLYFVELPLISR